MSSVAAGRRFTRYGKSPRFLYRRFMREEEAIALTHGQVWLSTLEHCRNAESWRQNDPGEGRASWVMNEPIDFATDPERARTVLSEMNRVGMGFGRTDAGGNFTMVSPDDLEAVGDFKIMETHHSYDIADAHVLCFSLDPKVARFGPYCVRIAAPEQFFAAVTVALDQLAGVASSGRFGKMFYGERERVGDTGHERHPAFIGPIGNADEREMRMLWELPPEMPLTCQALTVPAVIPLCSLMR